MKNANKDAIVKRRAFTLIELLVVSAIISLLLAILLPSLGSARKQAKSVVCTSNLHQLATAAFNYVANNQDLFPLAHGSNGDWDFSTATDDAGNTIRVLGILWQAAGPGSGGATGNVMRIEQCPSYVGRSATPTDPFTGYNYNTTYIGKGIGETIQRPARITDLAHPGSTALFGDGGYYGGVTNKFMRAPEPYPQSPDALSALARAAGTQAYRHRHGKTNVVFADGHADAQSERYTAGISIITPSTGFLSADNSLYKTR